MKNGIFKKLISSVLALAMVLALAPVIPMTAKAAPVGTDHVVDYSTMNSWQDLFGEDMLTTAYAGGVWTDKSVFTNANAFADVTKVNGSSAAANLSVTDGNFLVALSALATNKEIVGYSTIPTDTMLVLDLSNSMDTAKAVPSMVNATNDAIDRLLKLNNHNRVGVVLYSGRSANNGENAATLLLPMGRYKPASGKSYLTYTGDDDETTVRVANGLKNADGDAISGYKETVGATYIQAGLYATWQYMKDLDTTVAEGQIQGGTDRMPIVVLMSDGAPTLATTSYTNVGLSNRGNGSTATDITTFLTQLTAAWLKQNLLNKYGSVKFYTLGLGLGNNTEGTAVLNPSTSSSTLNSWWRTFVTADAGDNVTLGDSDNRFTVRRDSVIPTQSLRYNQSPDYTTRNYTDKYYPAANTREMITAFGQIVDQIIIQSQYYPTLVESGAHDLDGYISVEDPLGEFMEVKEIKGIVLGDTIFTGAALLEMMQDSSAFGSFHNPTSLGYELVNTVAERIGVSNSVAMTLLEEAWANGQLRYTNSTNFSNYIGWYANASGGYVGFWHEGHSADDVKEAVNDGAVYYVKSYGFYGQHEGNLHDSDMMHVVVQVRKNIATGDETVILQIPASLIPLVTYHVELEGKSLENAENVKMSIETASPIRLLFEVGLDSEITELNLMEKISAAERPHLDGNGGYYFYTNRWGDQDGGDIDYDAPNTHVAPFSHFSPSEENERYYYTESTIIYQNATATDGKPLGEGEGTVSNPYTNPNVKPTSGYFARTVIKATSTTADADGFYEARIVTEPKIMSASSCSNAVYDADLGCWVVPKGTEFRAFYEFRETKAGPAGGPTGTLAYSDYPVVIQTGTGTQGGFDVFNLLGNNGRMTVNPATGIQLTKEVDVVEPGTSTNNFVFAVTLTKDGNPVTGPVTLIRDGESTSLTLVDGKAELTLADGDTVYLTGLPADTDYTIHEYTHEDYEVKTATINGTAAAVTDGKVSGNVADKKVDSVVFTNTPKGEGHLVISKVVEHPFGAGYTAHLTKEFPITLTLTQNGAAYAGQTVTTNLGALTTDENGKLSFTLKHGEAVSVSNLPDGVSYAVSEDLTSFPGFSLTTTDLSGTIATDTTAYVGLINAYTPGKVSPVNITVDGEKILKGREWLDGDTFTFQLEKWDGSNWVAISGAVDSATKADPKFSLTQYMQAETIDEVGTYYYRVVELPPADGETSGITYDSTVRIFTVEVTGGDMSGTLEIADVTVREWVTVDKTTTPGTFAVWMDFTNRYAPKGSASVELNIDKVLIDQAGVTMTEEGFTFGLYNEADEKVAEATTDASGKAVIKMVYTPSLLDPVEEDGERLTEYEITYTLKEIAGDLKGMDYSEEVYSIQVTITDNLDGTISAVAVMTDDENATVTEASFTNTYDLGSVDATIEGTKTLTGRDMTADEFTFQLWKASNDQFMITATSGYPKNAVNVLNDDGTVSFSFTESFTKVGTYYYVVKEQVPDGHVNDVYEGVKYDTNKFHVIVTVTDNGEGGLDKSVTVVGGEIAFNNSYSTTAATLTLNGEKTFDSTITDGQFYFELYETDSNFENAVQVGDKVPNVGNAFAFPTITYADGDTANHYYIIKEFIPETAKNNIYDGVFYDSRSYKVTVTIADNGKGALVATPTYQVGDASAETVEFVNSVVNGDSVTISGTKTLTGKELTEGAYTFELYKANSTFNIVPTEGYPKTTTNGAPADGVAGFSFREHFMEEGTYRYVIKEKLPADNVFTKDGVRYDTTTFNVVVTVSYNGSGDLRATYTVENGPIAFVNEYTTFGEAPYVIGGTKQHDRTFADGDYSFQLWAADAEFNTVGEEALQTVSNKGGYFTFEKLSYTKADTYYYVIREQMPSQDSNASGDTVYDTTEYRLTVVVTDNGDGTLAVAVPTMTVTGSTEPANQLVFTNKLVTPNTVTISGTKVLESSVETRVLQEGEFTFILKQDGQEIARTTNAADGTFSFTDIALTYIGEHTFTVEELEGTDKHIIYTDAVYTVKVTTAYDGEGGLTVGEPVVTLEGETAEEIVFTNIYKHPGNSETGDEFQLVLVISLLAISAVGMGAVLILGRKKKETK